MIKIGTDIIQIGRIEKLYSKFGDRLFARILNETELKGLDQYSEQYKIRFLAKRFAAKEAFSKALGTGIGKDCSFQDITISNEKNGAPKIILNDKLDSFIKTRFSREIQVELSLSDDYPFALAFVVIYIA